MTYQCLSVNYTLPVVTIIGILVVVWKIVSVDVTALEVSGVVAELWANVGVEVAVSAVLGNTVVVGIFVSVVVVISVAFWTEVSDVVIGIDDLIVSVISVNFGVVVVSVVIELYCISNVDCSVNVELCPTTMSNRPVNSKDVYHSKLLF